MARVLILCYGNPLRGDDAIGWMAAEELTRDFACPESPRGHVEVVACHQLTPELAERLSEVDRVVFVDACAVGTPGQVTCGPVEPAPWQDQALSHHLHPAALLGLSKELYGRAPTAAQCSVCGASFDHSDGLSPDAATALPTLLEHVLQAAGLA